MQDFKVEIKKSENSSIPCLYVYRVIENNDSYHVGLIRRINDKNIYTDDQLGSLELDTGLNLDTAAIKIKEFINTKITENPAFDIFCEDEEDE